MKYCVVLINRLFALSFIYLFLFISPLFAQKSGLEQLRNTLKKGEAFKAELNHTFIDSFTGDTLMSNGLLWIHQNGYRIEMDDKIIAVFDKKSTVYNIIKNQVIISNYSKDDDDFAPSRFINASKKEFEINEKRIDDGWSIEFVAKDDFAVFSQIIMDLDKNAQPKRLIARDQNGNTNISEFSSAGFVAFTKEIKEVKYPKAAEIIDLRE